MIKQYLYALPICCFLACTANGSKKNKPATNRLGVYNLQQYQKVVLPQELDEISGIAWDSSTHQLAAINDEEGKLFFFDAATGTVQQRVKFGRKGDYEEVFFAKGCWWILRSDGTFERCIYPSVTDTLLTTFAPLVPDQAEYEAAWYDPAADRIWLLCKKCGSKKAEMTGIEPYPGKTSAVTVIALDFSHLQTHKKFPASAAAINPLDGFVYAISSTDKKILRMSANGVVVDLQPLDPAVFKQPEGLCFAPDGTLYISNEAAGGNANLLIFKPQPQQP